MRHMLLLGLAVISFGATALGAAQRGRIIDYASPPTTLSAFVREATAIVRGRVGDKTFVENPTFRELTAYRIDILEVLKGDDQLHEGSALNVYRFGGMRNNSRAIDTNFPEDFTTGEELVLFLSSNKNLSDGYFVAYGPHGAYRMASGRWTPFGRSVVGEAQRLKPPTVFIAELKKAATAK